MATNIRYYYGTDAQILALTPVSASWQERAFYYPSDKSYFYQIVDGELVKYGSGSASVTGVNINGQVIGGVKQLITETEVLEIPQDYEYNIHRMQVDGIVNNYGTINIEN